MKLAPYITLGAFGLARELLASDDPKKRTSPPTEAHIATVAEVTSGKPMPCGVKQVANGFTTIDFGRHFLIQRDSLRAEFGDAVPGLVGNIVTVPRLSQACAVSWCQSWIAIFEEFAELRPELLNPLVFGFDGLGGRFKEVQRQEALAGVNAVFGGDTGATYSRSGEVIRAVANLANAMDSAIHVDLSSGLPSTLDLLGDSAKERAKDAGSSIAFVIENLLGPIAGAGIAATMGVLGSALAPYLILGGATYYVVKRKL